MNISEEISKAYSLLSRILVSGDAVDFMSAARKHLFNALTEANKLNETANAPKNVERQK